MGTTKNKTPSGKKNETKSESKDNVYDFPGTGPQIDGLSSAVRYLITNDKMVRACWENRGRTFPREGIPGDGSRESYDWTLVNLLVTKNIDDREALIAAIENRPDGAVKMGGKDQTYAAALVDEVLDHFKEMDKEDDIIEVDGVWKTDSNPIIVGVIIDGIEITFDNTEELTDAAKFQNRALNALGRILDVPGKRKAWIRQVQSWMERAEIRNLPPEASVEFSLKMDVVRAVEGLRPGEIAADLDRKLKLVVEGRNHFKLATVLSLLNKDASATEKIKKGKLVKILKDLGCEKEESGHFIADFKTGKRVKIRTWKTPASWPPTLDDEVVPPTAENVDPNQLPLPGSENWGRTA